MSIKSLNAKVQWALKPEAIETLDTMEHKLQIDRDLALNLLEQLCSEEALYDLPIEDEEEDDSHVG